MKYLKLFLFLLIPLLSFGQQDLEYSLDPYCLEGETVLQLSKLRYNKVDTIVAVKYYNTATNQYVESIDGATYGECPSDAENEQIDKLCELIELDSLGTISDSLQFEKLCSILEVLEGNKDSLMLEKLCLANEADSLIFDKLCQIKIQDSLNAIDQLPFLQLCDNGRPVFAYIGGNAYYLDNTQYTGNLGDLRDCGLRYTALEFCGYWPETNDLIDLYLIFDPVSFDFFYLSELGVTDVRPIELTTGFCDPVEPVIPDTTRECREGQIGSIKIDNTGAGLLANTFEITNSDGSITIIEQPAISLVGNKWTNQLNTWMTLYQAAYPDLIISPRCNKVGGCGGLLPPPDGVPCNMFLRYLHIEFCPSDIYPIGVELVASDSPKFKPRQMVVEVYESPIIEYYTCNTCENSGELRYRNGELKDQIVEPQNIPKCTYYCGGVPEIKEPVCPITTTSECAIIEATEEEGVIWITSSSCPDLVIEYWIENEEEVLEPVIILGAPYDCITGEEIEFECPLLPTGITKCARVLGDTVQIESYIDCNENKVWSLCESTEIVPLKSIFFVECPTENTGNVELLAVDTLVKDSTLNRFSTSARCNCYRFANVTIDGVTTQVNAGTTENPAICWVTDPNDVDALHPLLTDPDLGLQAALIRDLGEDFGGDVTFEIVNAGQTDIAIGCIPASQFYLAGFQCDQTQIFFNIENCGEKIPIVGNVGILPIPNCPIVTTSTLDQALGECCTGGANGFDVSDVPRLCTKVNYDKDNNAFSAVCPDGWTAQDLLDVLNESNPNGNVWELNGEVLSVVSGTPPTSLWFISLEPAVEVTPTTGGECKSVIHTKDCNSDAILEAILALDKCDESIVSNIICASSEQEKIELSDGQIVTIAEGVQLILAQKIDCNNNLISYTVSVSIGGVLFEAVSPIDAGECPNGAPAPVKLNCIVDEKGQQWEAFQAILNGDLITYYVNEDGTVGQPAGETKKCVDFIGLETQKVCINDTNYIASYILYSDETIDTTYTIDSCKTSSLESVIVKCDIETPGCTIAGLPFMNETFGDFFNAPDDAWFIDSLYVTCIGGAQVAIGKPPASSGQSWLSNYNAPYDINFNLTLWGLPTIEQLIENACGADVTVTSVGNQLQVTGIEGITTVSYISGTESIKLLGSCESITTQIDVLNSTDPKKRNYFDVCYMEVPTYDYQLSLEICPNGKNRDTETITISNGFHGSIVTYTQCFNLTDAGIESAVLSQLASLLDQNGYTYESLDVSYVDSLATINLKCTDFEFKLATVDQNVEITRDYSGTITYDQCECSKYTERIDLNGSPTILLDGQGNVISSLPEGLIECCDVIPPPRPVSVPYVRCQSSHVMCDDAGKEYIACLGQDGQISYETVEGFPISSVYSTVGRCTGTAAIFANNFQGVDLDGNNGLGVNVVSIPTGWAAFSDEAKAYWVIEQYGQLGNWVYSNNRICEEPVYQGIDIYTFSNDPLTTIPIRQTWIAATFEVSSAPVGDINTKNCCCESSDTGGTSNITLSKTFENRENICYSGTINANGTLADLKNVTISKIGTGWYQVTFSSPMPNGDYQILTQVHEGVGGAARDDIQSFPVTNTENTAGFQIFIGEQDNGGTAGLSRDRRVSFWVSCEESELIDVNLIQNKQ